MIVYFSGNANAYYTNTRFSGDLRSPVKGAPTSESANMVSTGLLPSALGIGGKTRQNDLDIAFQVTFFTLVSMLKTLAQVASLAMALKATA